jgi:integrase
MPKLTKRVVDALSPDPAGRADVFKWDSEMRGFGVRMKPSGSASWFVQYRNADGRTRRLVLGKVGTLTPDAARVIAREKLTDAAKGKDPSADRHATRHAMTVAELCDIYLADAEAAARIKASTIAMDRSRIDRHIKPLIGKRTVRSLTPGDIAKLQTDIAAGKTAAPRAEKGRAGNTTGGRGVASRTTGMLGTILEFAKRRQMIPTNPARGVEKMPDGKQRRYLSVEEIGKLGKAMRDAKEHESATAVAAVRFLLLTGCRRMEALTLPWEWVDQRSRCIRFGDTKSGAQLRPIGAAVVSMLEMLTRRDGCRYVFPAERGDGGGHFVGLPRALARLCRRANLVPGVTVHVLRHSFASAAAELGFSELTIAGLLGHAVPGVTARYAHVPDRALLAAADQVAAYIAAALNGQAGADVIAFPAATIHEPARAV